MLLLWMLYTVTLAALLGLAALSLEQLLRWAGLAARGVWCASIGASLAFAAAGWLWRSPSPEPLPATAAPGGALQLPGELSALPVESTVASQLLALLDGVAPAAWAALSLLVLLSALRAALALRTQRRRWRRAVEEGRSVLISEAVGPALVGVVRPDIVLPRWALELPRPWRRMALAHEEEHRRARDPLVLLFGFLAAATLPWSPALWWQLRRLRLAVEVDCDARVLRSGAGAADYGALLLTVGARAARRGMAAAALTEPRSFLETRIRAMTSRNPSHLPLRAAAVTLLATGLLAVACEAPRPMEPTPPPPQDIAPTSQAAAPASLEPGLDSGRSGRVTGVVVDAATSEPIAGARVWVEGTGRGTLSQNDGRYFVLDMPDGGTLRFDKEGYASVRHLNVPVREPGATVVMTIRLPAEAPTSASRPSAPASTSVEEARRSNVADARGRITGVVTKASTGEPLAGVRVFLRGFERGVITQANGRFFMVNVPAGPFTVVAELDGYATVAMQNVEVRGDATTTRNITLPAEPR